MGDMLCSGGVRFAPEKFFVSERAGKPRCRVSSILTDACAGCCGARVCGARVRARVREGRYGAATNWGVRTLRGGGMTG